MVQPYNITVMATAWKNSCFILSQKSDFHMVDIIIIIHSFSSF